MTGIVHFFLLRPLLDLHGADYVADKLLHMAVPALASRAGCSSGPGRGSTAPLSLVDRLAARLPRLRAHRGRGQRVVPVPVPGRRREGLGPVLGAAVGITALFLACFGVAALIDRRLAPSPGNVARTASSPCRTSLNDVDSGERPILRPPGSR